MIRLKQILAIATLAISAAVLSARAEDHPPAAASTLPSALSSDVQTALRQLTSDKYAERDNAMKSLEVALGRQMAALVACDGPEAKTRLAALLNFNDGLTQWALNSLSLSAEARKSEIDFALRPDVLPITARLFSSRVDDRIEGARAIAKFKDPAADLMLAQMLRDPERAVYVTAMDVVCDRPPITPVIDALWERAMADALPPDEQPQPRKEVSYRGRVVAIVPEQTSSIRPIFDDPDLACEALICLKAPEVQPRIVAFFARAESAYFHALAAPGQPARSYLGDYGNSRIGYALAVAYKPRGLVPILFRVATGPAVNAANFQLYGKKVYRSARTPAIQALLEITDQKPQDYQLKPLPNGEMWVFGAESDEIQAIQKLQHWRLDNPAFFPTENAETTPTHPAEPPH